MAAPLGLGPRVALGRGDARGRGGVPIEQNILVLCLICIDCGRFQRAAALLRQEEQRGLPATRLRRANQDADSTGGLCRIPASEAAAGATRRLRDAAARFRREGYIARITAALTKKEGFVPRGGR